MFGKKKSQVTQPEPEKKEEKPTPAYLREDYPYQPIGDPITDLDSLEPTGVLYEIKCNKCEMSYRSQGCNIKGLYDKLMSEKGCVGCGNKELVVRKIDTSKMKTNA